ncbi:MAG: pyridoxal-phosphate dependent enzyme [Acidobacteria bacterium]|nr:pyridoxal-phosphate dependent enzyme [Acidobacteriota bacterium]
MLPLKKAIRPTTFIESAKLKDYFGLDITIATETFQHTGSFKFRAAYNLASQVPNDTIITASSGNFGQGLAYACKLLGKNAVIVMPDTSAKVKIEAIRGYGAQLDLIDINRISRNERVEQLAAEMPEAYKASAYNDEFVIEGNATLGDELSDKSFDAVLVPVGGGGLISGVIRGLAQNKSNAEVYGCEPLLANDAARSFQAGEIVANEKEPLTIADGARTISLGNLNWPIIQSSVKDFIEVSDENIANALRLYFTLANLKCEPTGAVSLGAILENRERFTGKKICLIVSGGNVDPLVYSQLLG